jgi:hypothetical protein
VSTETSAGIRPPVPGRHPIGRPARYGAVSVVAGLLAQAGLLVAYAGFGWSTFAAVLFSLAVSVGPSYWGCRTYVWAGLSRHSVRVESTSFALIALAGSAAATGLTRLAELLGQAFTADRVLLGLWVSGGSVAATVLVWVVRYVVLDRAVFGSRPAFSSRLATSSRK